MELLLKKLQNAKLAQFGNSVSDLVVFLTDTYAVLFDHGQAPVNWRRIAVDALGSGTNANFNQYVSRLEDQYENPAGMRVRLEADQILVLAEERYLDMRERGVWNVTDPKDAEIMALTTKVNALLQAQQTAATALTTSTSGGGSSVGEDKPFDLQDKTWKKIPGTKMFEWHTIPQGDEIVVCGRKN